MKVYFFYSLFLVVLLSACEDELIPNPTPTLTILEQLQTDANYSELTKALSKAGLDNRLQVSGPLTFFAPDNTALAAFLGDETVESVDGEYLQQILSYHLVPKLLLKDDFDNRGYLTTSSEVDSLLKRLSIAYVKDGDQLVINNVANVSLAGNELDNGVVYPVNQVLNLPTLASLLANQADYHRIVKGFDLVNFTNDLGISGRKTLLLPQDNAFDYLLDSVGVSDMESLQAAIPSLFAPTINYHIVPDTHFLVEDLDSSIIVGKNGQNIAIRLDTLGAAFLVDFAGNAVHFEETNIQATNGMIHLIDTLLVPAGF